MSYFKSIEDHPVLGVITEWTYLGSEQNVWRGGDVGLGGNTFEFVIGNSDAKLDGWFSVAQLRAIADYMEKN